MAEGEGESDSFFAIADVFLVGGVEDVFGLVGYFKEDSGEVDVSTTGKVFSKFY